jgi:hypothetical protein
VVVLGIVGDEKDLAIRPAAGLAQATQEGPGRLRIEARGFAPRDELPVPQAHGPAGAHALPGRVV